MWFFHKNSEKYGTKLIKIYKKVLSPSLSSDSVSNGHRNPVKLTHPSMFFCVDSATSMKVKQTNEYVCYKATNQCISTAIMQPIRVSFTLQPILQGNQKA